MEILKMLTTSLSYTDPEPTITMGFNQIWLKNGVPSSTEVMGGTLFIGDVIRNTQTNDEYQILTLEKNPDVYGEYNNITYQVRITSQNINQYLSTSK
jgi:hypothetical protein